MKVKLNGKKLAALKAFKKFAIGGLIFSAVALIVIAIFSLFPTAGGKFTIRFDDPQKLPNITISDDSKGEKIGTYFLGNPMKNVYQTRLEDVYATISSKRIDEIGGSQNITDKLEDGTDFDEALVYTVFISVSGEEDEIVNATVNLDGYDAPKNSTNGPLDYLRVLTYVSEISEDKQSESNVKTTVYGKNNIHNEPTVLGDDDFREAVSYFTKYKNDDLRTRRKSDYALNDQEYCEPFVSSNVGEQLVKQELYLEKGKTYRYTFVAYFEGFDPDGYGIAPTDSSLLMSLHFGK